MIRKMGHSQILTEDEEANLLMKLLHIADAGFPAIKNQLLDSAQKLINELNRKTPVLNGRQNRHWYESFLRQ